MMMDKVMQWIEKACFRVESILIDIMYNDEGDEDFDADSKRDEFRTSAKPAIRMGFTFLLNAIITKAVTKVLWKRYPNIHPNNTSGGDGSI